MQQSRLCWQKSERESDWEASEGSRLNSTRMKHLNQERPFHLYFCCQVSLCYICVVKALICKVKSIFPCECTAVIMSSLSLWNTYRRREPSPSAPQPHMKTIPDLHLNWENSKNFIVLKDGGLLNYLIFHSVLAVTVAPAPMFCTQISGFDILKIAAVDKKYSYYFKQCAWKSASGRSWEKN